MSVYDLGYDLSLNRVGQAGVADVTSPSLSGNGLSSPVGGGSSFSDGADPSQMHSGELTGNLTMVDGFMQSGNFVAGSAGWKIYPTGDVEFNDGTFRGTITATAGAIGGFTIGATSITDAAGTFGMSSAVTGGDDIRFWAGHATPASAPFRVTEAGVLTAASGTIGGFTITATKLYGSTIQTSATVGSGSNGVIMDTAGIRGYSSTLGTVFNLPTDGSAPTFASGIINTTVFNVSSTGVIRTSSTVGNGTASSAGVLINDTGIYACEANQLLANANVKILSTGGGQVVLGTTGFVRGGQTAYNTGAGFFLGYDTSAYKFSIGNPSGNRMTWDGSNLFVKAAASNMKIYAVVRNDGTGDYTTVKAAIDAGENEIFIDYSDASVTDSSAITIPAARNIIITGNGKWGSWSWISPKITIGSQSSLELRNLNVYNPTSGTFLVQSGTDYMDKLYIENCYFLNVYSNSAEFIKVGDCRNFYCVNNRFEMGFGSSGSDGRFIEITPSTTGTIPTNAIIHGNTFKIERLEKNLKVIKMPDYASRIDISENFFEINASTVTSSAITFMLIDANVAAGSGVFVTGNQFYSALGTPKVLTGNVYIHLNGYAEYANNTFNIGVSVDTSGSATVVQSDGTDGRTVTGNVFITNLAGTSTTVSVISTNTYGSVTGNIFRITGSSGTPTFTHAVIGANTTFTGNTMLTSTGVCVKLSADCQVVGNNFGGGATTGVDVNSAARCIVVGNSFATVTTDVANAAGDTVNANNVT